MLYTFEDKAYWNRIKAIEDARQHEHSSAPEDNDRFKVVVCHNHTHMALSFLACCFDRAHEYAEQFCMKNFGMIVDVVEIWDGWDIEQGEPGETYYPDNHVKCPNTPCDCDELGKALYCHVGV